jgi:hypothetical protein
MDLSSLWSGGFTHRRRATLASIASAANLGVPPNNSCPDMNQMRQSPSDRLAHHPPTKDVSFDRASAHVSGLEQNLKVRNRAICSSDALDERQQLGIV